MNGTHSSSRRILLAILVVAGATGLIVRPLGAAAKPSADRRPNILFFLIDDQRNDSLGCAGHPIIKTPAVDKLARGGVRFENAFVTTSICAASRASIFTGLYERTHGFTFGTPPLRKSDLERSYPVLLRDAGYRTGFVGKFGVGLEGGKPTRDRMFDYFKSPGGPRFLKQPDGSLRHSVEVCGDEAEAFIKSHPKGRPFCLSVSFHSVHAVDGNHKPGIGHYPWPKAVNGMYDDLVIPPPRLSDPTIFESQPDFLKTSLNRVRYYWRWDTPEKYQANIRAYFRMISGVDRVIGRVLGTLKQQGLAENTVVVYMGDNGYYMGNRGFAGKWSHYEESLRVPLIVFDPRVAQDMRGKIDSRMGLNIDLPATFLDLAGIEVPARYQGRSLVPLLRGENPQGWREEFFCEHLMSTPKIPKYEGVRGKRYVYARYFGQNPPYEFLHDLDKDPDQLVNFVGDVQYESVLGRLRKRCDELRDTYISNCQAAPRL